MRSRRDGRLGGRRVMATTLTLFLDPANRLDLSFIFSNKDIFRKALYWFLYQGFFLQFQLAFPVLKAIEQNSTSNQP
jgi:hypothetical protein